ncbi:MAG TPA: efflux transporter outer membrane subunit [Candidatus Brocadiia bacterium]|nr:efflux transporter outer membrane subunit [Candidatus Brocadiia bacterium]
MEESSRKARTWAAKSLSTLAAVVALALPSCKAGPDYQPPDVAAPADWGQTDPSLRREPAQLAQWWQALKDRALDQLIASAYSQNLSLRVVGLRVLEARASRGVAAGDFFPQMQALTAGYERTLMSRKTANVSPTHDFDTTSFGGEISWELDVWGRFRRAIEAADADLAAAALSYDDAIVSLAAEVAGSYVELRSLDEKIALAKESAVLQAKSLEIAEARSRAGGATDLDVEQAKTLLADTRSQIPGLIADRQRALNRLCLLLGAPPGALNSLLAAPGVIPTPPASLAVGLPANLVRRRPDVRRAEREAASQCARIGVAKAALYPAFSLAGTFGWQAQSAADLFSVRSRDAGFGPSMTWDVLNYGRLINQVRAQDARFEQALNQHQETVLRALQEVEDAMSAFTRGREQVALLIEAVEAAKRALDLAMVQYEAGGADYTRVLDTQTSLLQQQLRLVSARSGVVHSVISLNKALGGGWQLRAGQEYAPPESIERMKARTSWGDVIAPNYSQGRDLLLFPRPGVDITR